MEYKELKYIYKASGIKNAYTLLLLHGTGGDENDLLPIAAKFGNEINILSLRGNVSEAGMPRFFRRLGMGVFDEKDLAFRTHEMVSFIKQLAEKENFNAEKLIALGYSNGANIAGSTLLMYPDFLAGAILYRPMQPFKEISNNIKTTKQVPVFMSNGLADPTINPHNTKAYIEMLGNIGFKVTACSLETGHNLTLRDIDISTEWYRKHFSAEMAV